MAKYIIDIPDNTHWIQWIMEGTKDHHPYTDWKMVEDLTTYTEPDHKAIEDEVWEFLGEILEIDGCDYVNLFDSETIDCLTEMTYSEAKAKYEAWKKKKEEIRVGDEIVGIYSDGEKSPPLVVFKVEGNYYYGIYSKTGEFVQGGLNYEKTGRHFEEVEKLLESMR